jgi:hypothetical protein
MSIIEYDRRYKYIRLLDKWLLDDILISISKLYMELVDKRIIDYFRRYHNLDITKMEMFLWYGKRSDNILYHRLITIAYYDVTADFDR